MLFEVKLNPGDTLYNENEASDCLYLVKSGELRAFKYKDGKSVVLGYIQPGEIVGEMSFLNGEAHSATVKANLETVVMMMNRAQFNEILNGAHPVIKTLVVGLASRLKKSNNKLMA